MRRSFARVRVARPRCRIVPVLLVAALSIMWAASVCSANRGEIHVSGFVYPVMELIINDSLIEWDRLRCGENVCPLNPTYTVLSNVPFRVTISSPHPYMRVTDSGSMQGLALKNPLQWSTGELGGFAELNTEPETVIYGDISSHETVHTLIFAQDIDVTDQPSTAPTQRYKTEILLSLEAVQ